PICDTNSADPTKRLRKTWDVRFGSKADIGSAQTHVRFTPNSDRKSRHPHKVMSALPPIADMCGATAHVCFGPKADSGADRMVSRNALYYPGRYHEYGTD